MSRLRRSLLSWLIDVRVRAASNRMDRAELEARARHLSFESDTGRLGVRVTEFLRDRLRRAWLRLRSSR